MAHAMFHLNAATGPPTPAAPILGNDTEAAAWSLPFPLHELERYRSVIPSNFQPQNTIKQSIFPFFVSVSVTTAAHSHSLPFSSPRNDSAEMFRFSFRNYMEHAFPRDDLRPLSCRGSDSQGGIALTLLDALDALVIFEDLPALREAVAFVDSHPNLFDVDTRVHVFEVTIRALGGLLSAHTLATADPTLVPGYDGALLRAAANLGNRLMPAFDTPTGLPLSWINLRRGRVPGDTRVTCTACAGTLLLELGFLSRLTGNETYESRARHAVETIWGE